MKQFFRLLTTHSEAQPYYPPVPMDTKVAVVPFHNDKKNQIVWNAAFQVYKEELTTLALSCREDLKGHCQTCKGKFLLAGQHKNTKEAKSSNRTKKPAQAGGGGKTTGKQGGCSYKQSGAKEKFYGEWPFCGIKGHHARDCFKNPKSNSYIKPKTAQKTDHQSKKRKLLGGKTSVEQWKQKKDYKQYCQEVGTTRWYVVKIGARFFLNFRALTQ